MRTFLIIGGSAILIVVCGLALYGGYRMIKPVPAAGLGEQEGYLVVLMDSFGGYVAHWEATTVNIAGGSAEFTDRENHVWKLSGGNFVSVRIVAPVDKWASIIEQYTDLLRHDARLGENAPAATPAPPASTPPTNTPPASTPPASANVPA